MSKPIVALVGRPNVGKSTLFNRIAGSRIAIVEDIPGLTRDRIYQDVEWAGHKFVLVDTGGIQTGNQEDITSQVRAQAEIAIAEADLVLFLVDAKTGITTGDEDVARLLHKSAGEVILVVNKVDNFSSPGSGFDFFSLGLGEPVTVSAVHGLNIGDLLDRVIAVLPRGSEEEDIDRLRIAVVGRPNVGKSSLVNKILGEDRVLVSDQAGTTRDAIDTEFTREGTKYVLVDTAGLRRKSRITESLERYSVLRTLRAIDRADIVLLLIDATTGTSEQDKKIAGYVHEAGKGTILLVNKWDLVAKDDKTADRYREKIRQELVYMSYAPIIFASALTGQRLPKVLETIDFVAEEGSKRVPTGDLNRLIREATLITPPPTHKGRQLKVFYATQGGIKPPTFIFFVNDPELMHFSYQRYLENRLRECYGYQGNPLRIIVRHRSKGS